MALPSSSHTNKCPVPVYHSIEEAYSDPLYPAIQPFKHFNAYDYHQTHELPRKDLWSADDPMNGPVSPPQQDDGTISLAYGCSEYDGLVFPYAPQPNPSKAKRDVSKILIGGYQSYHVSSSRFLWPFRLERMNVRKETSTDSGRHVLVKAIVDTHELEFHLPNNNKGVIAKATYNPLRRRSISIHMTGEEEERSMKTLPIRWEHTSGGLQTRNFRSSRSASPPPPSSSSHENACLMDYRSAGPGVSYLLRWERMPSPDPMPNDVQRVQCSEVTAKGAIVSVLAWMNLGDSDRNYTIHLRKDLKPTSGRGLDVILGFMALKARKMEIRDLKGGGKPNYGEQLADGQDLVLKFNELLEALINLSNDISDGGGGSGDGSGGGGDGGGGGGGGGGSGHGGFGGGDGGGGGGGGDGGGGG